MAGWLCAARSAEACAPIHIEACGRFPLAMDCVHGRDALPRAAKATNIVAGYRQEPICCKQCETRCGDDHTMSSSRHGKHPQALFVALVSLQIRSLTSAQTVFEDWRGALPLCEPLCSPMGKAAQPIPGNCSLPEPQVAPERVEMSTS